jgi:DNA-binding cell septation regulator SpoVG
MRIERMTLLEHKTMKARFNLVTNENIEIKFLKLIEGQNGFFLSFPSFKGTNGKFCDYIYMPKEMKDELLELVKVEYSKLSGIPADSSDVDVF